MFFLHAITDLSQMKRFHPMQVVRDWTLIFSILSGIAGYFLFEACAFPPAVHRATAATVSVLQPLLIFCMLFLTFCRINPRSLRFKPWHGLLLLFQGGCFTLLALLLVVFPHCSIRVEVEGAMLCLICPTATAAAVITRKLGGQLNNVTTYTILINLLVALLIPAASPLVHPQPGLDFLTASAIILAKVFPLLLLPLVAALILRYLWPRLHFELSRYANLSFYLWAVSLALAIAVTTRSIVHSAVAVDTMLWLVVISLVCCALQFWLGRKIGARYGDTITAGQALGQKNTVLIIWMGYTFFTPVTSMVGGFYSIWHNLVNSWQLARHRKIHNPS